MEYRRELLHLIPMQLSVRADWQDAEICEHSSNVASPRPRAQKPRPRSTVLEAEYMSVTVSELEAIGSPKWKSTFFKAAQKSRPLSHGLGKGSERHVGVGERRDGSGLHTVILPLMHQCP